MEDVITFAMGQEPPQQCSQMTQHENGVTSQAAIYVAGNAYLGERELQTREIQEAEEVKETRELGEVKRWRFGTLSTRQVSNETMDPGCRHTVSASWS